MYRQPFYRGPIAESLFRKRLGDSAVESAVTHQASMIASNAKKALEEETCARYFKDFAEAVRKVQYLRKPVIAAVNSLAYGGGCEMTLVCDV